MSDNPKIRRRLRCPNCVALDTLKWGVRNGVQRYKCRNCQSLFSARRKEISKSNRFIWFKKWVLGKMTVEDIAEISGYSSRQLHRWFDEYLDEYFPRRVKYHCHIAIVTNICKICDESR